MMLIPQTVRLPQQTLPPTNPPPPTPSPPAYPRPPFTRRARLVATHAPPHIPIPTLLVHRRDFTPSLEPLLQPSPGEACKAPPPYPQNLTLKERIKQEPEGYEPVKHEGTGVDEDELGYQSYLVSVEEAVEKLGRGSVMADVVLKGWKGVQDRFVMEDGATSESSGAV
jgi:hypothetical protein